MSKTVPTTESHEARKPVLSVETLRTAARFTGNLFLALVAVFMIGQSGVDQIHG
ncbi:MAG TPA: hypothetical protein VIL00_02680 [Pseudonocardiaceae bacterium]